MEECLRTELGVLYKGDAIEVLKSLPDESVAMFVKEKMEQAWDYCLEKAKEFGNRVAEVKLEVEEPNVSEVWEK